MQKLIEFIKELMNKGFYGKITINFQNGKIVNCVKEESIKLT